jgi:cytochrome c-type biogenesis protein
MTTAKRTFNIIFLSLILSLIIAFTSVGDGIIEDSADQTTERDNIDSVLAVPDGYVHRPIMELFTGLGCTYCQNGPDQAADRLFHEALDEPSQPHNIVVFHQNNGAGDDDLTTPESQERYDDNFVSGTPNAQFDGGFRQASGGEDGEDANYQTYSQALADSYTRYEDSTLNPFDNNFKFVNLQIFQEFSGDGYRVSVKVEYLGSASDRPSLGLLPINSPDLSGSLYVFMTEDNVTAWSSERNGGEYVDNYAAFRGNAIKDEQFTLARDETFEIMAEWEFPEDPVIPIKPGDITAVAVVYDLDDTSSGRSDGGNPASIPRAIQSANPKSTAYDLGNDLPTVGEIDFIYDGEAQISAKFDDEDGISKAYMLYNTEGSNSTNWEYMEMEISGEELCDESGACYAFTDSEGIASIPMNEKETLYYQILIYDGNQEGSTEGKTGMFTYDAKSSSTAVAAGPLPIALILMALGIILLVGGFVYILRERLRKDVGDIQQDPEIYSPGSDGHTPGQEAHLPHKRSSKTMIMGIVILGILLISMGAVAAVFSSGNDKAPELEMRDVDGNEIKLSDYEGKVVFLEFMSIECPTCQKLNKHMNEVYAEYKDDIVMISVDVEQQETASDLKDYAEEKGSNWIFAIPKDHNVVRTSFFVEQIPKVYIIDKEGYVTYEGVGDISTGELKEKISAAKSGMAPRITIYSQPLIILAFAAGVASFFSPCSFPMLPGYVGYYLGKDEQVIQEQDQKKKILKKALPTGIAAAFGILIVYLLLGALIMIIGAPIYPYITILAPIAAIFVIVLGILMLTNYQYYFITDRVNKYVNAVLSRIKFKDKTLADRINDNELGGIFAYGMGYGFAAAGCTLPIFLLIITGALSTGGFLSGMLMFLVYGLGAAIFMVAVTLLVATSKDSILNKMKMSTHKIKVISGLFMIVAGIALLAGFYIVFMA